MAVAGNDPARRRGHRGRGSDDQSHGEEADGAQVRTEVAQGGEVGGRPQDGRQEDQEDHVRIELEHGHFGQGA